MADAIDRLTTAIERHGLKRAEHENRERVEREGRPVRDPFADYDALGRKVPQRMTAATFARSIPGYWERFDKRVPDDRFTVEGDVAVVACTCSNEHRVDLHVPFTAECGRQFIYDGKGGVRVAMLTPGEGTVGPRT